MLARRSIGFLLALWFPSLAVSQMPLAPAAPEEKLLRIVPNAIELKRVENRWQIYSNRQLVKDLGSSESEAAQAVRLIRDLNLTHYGTIPGAQPAFEYWLSEGEAPKAGFATRTIIPFRAAKLKVEQVAGAWCLRDDQQVLYNFGVDLENAKRAFVVCKRFGFNELGVIGNPPLMTYLLADERDNLGKPQQQTPSALALMSAVAEQGLILPNLGYVGSRRRIEWRKIEVGRVRTEWCLSQGSEVLARFGASQTDALIAYRQLQDTKATELCCVGTTRIPLYLVNGRLPTGSPLGVNRIAFRAIDLKVQPIRDNWYIMDAGRILFEMGDKKADAELMVKVLKELQADQIWELGQPHNGGLRVVSKSR